MHDIGINAGDGTRMVCDCGYQCADLDAWHWHTVRTYNNPDQRAIRLRGRRVHTILTIEPGHEPAHQSAHQSTQPVAITECMKVGCAAQGNSGQCWTLEMPGYPRLFGLPSRRIAQDLVRRGGVVSGTYQLSTC